MREWQAKEKELEDMEARLSAVVQENVRAGSTRTPNYVVADKRAGPGVCRALFVWGGLMYLHVDFDIKLPLVCSKL